MNSLKIITLFLIFLYVSSAKMTTKGSKQKICKKLQRPLREIQDLFEAIDDVNSSIANHSLDNITKNAKLDGDVENLFLLYSAYLTQFKERVIALNASLPQSLLEDCATLLTTINTANSNLEEYKKLAKETQKALNKLMDGDF
jgi:hypothetical protein